MKDRILQIATEKFIQIGYMAFNMDDLCRDLGISKKTLYEYFPSKKELFQTSAQTVFDEMRSESHAVLDKMIENDEFHFFDQLKNMFDVVNKHHKKLKPIFMSDLRKYAPDVWGCTNDFEAERRGYFDKIWALGTRDGMIKKDINKNVYYLMYFGILHTLMRPDILADLSISSYQALEQIYEILMTGILTDDGYKEFKEKVN